jgi:polar amino acid transport system substrate-binding protein
MEVQQVHLYLILGTNMPTALRHLLLLLLWVWAPVCWSGQKLVLASTDYPPYFDQALPEQGTVTALTRAAFKAAGYDITLVFLPWARLMYELKEGKYDGVVAVWYAADRESFLALTDPVVQTNIGFYANASKRVDVSKLEKLKGHTIGTVRGYANPLNFEAAHLQTEEVGNDITNLRKLDKARIDLALVDKALAKHLIKQEWPDGNNNLVWLEPPVQTMPLFVGISRYNPDFGKILSNFNKGLGDIKRSGEYDKILRRLPLD